MRRLVLNTGVHSRLAAVSAVALAMALGAAPGAFAQAVDSERNTVVVTGTALPIEAEKIGNSLTIVSGEQIEASGYEYLSDALRQVPGLSVNRTGPFGGITQVRTRGSEGNHTLVLIDGVDTSDAGDGETDLSTLITSADVERIEVIRGPQSGLYGSNALAGVINVITRREVDGTYYRASAEGGSFDTQTVDVGAGIGDGRNYLSAGLVNVSTDGFDSSTAGTFGGTFPYTNDKEGNEASVITARGGWQLNPTFRIDALARHLDKESDLDGFDFSGVPGQQGLAVDSPASSDTKNFSSALTATYDPMGGNWVTTGSAAFTSSQVEGLDPDGNYGDYASRLKVLLQSSYKFGDAAFQSTVTPFVEQKEERFKNTHPDFDPSQIASKTRSTTAFGAEYRADINDIHLSAAVRRDQNDEFDDDTTYSVAGAWVLPSSTRLHASVGSGVKNPSFFEQFGFIPTFFTGNPNLKPEKSEGWDIGAEQRLMNDRLVVDVTYFEATLEDKIGSSLCGGSVCNLPGKADRSGVEVSGRFFPTDTIDLIGSYTYNDSSAGDGSPEVRIPENQAALDANWRPMPALQLTLGVTYNGDQFDNDFRGGFTAVKTSTEGYTLARLAASYQLTDEIELFGRVENLGDEVYQENIGYAVPGRAAYVGIRFRGGSAK